MTSNEDMLSDNAALTGAEWLDVHYAACQPEYEEMMCRVGFQTGWRVLDAGCGGGSYLPLLAQLVGSTGKVTAIDLNVDTVNVVRKRLAAWQLPCPVTIETGNLLPRNSHS